MLVRFIAWIVVCSWCNVCFLNWGCVGVPYSTECNVLFGHGEEDTEGLSVAISALSEKTITAVTRNLYKVASTQSKLVSMQ